MVAGKERSIMVAGKEGSNNSSWQGEIYSGSW
jgi:hypothetical protein